MIPNKYLGRYYQYICSWKSIRKLIGSFLFILILIFIFQTLVFQIFKIPSGSMKPGLQIGDYLFVEKFTYGYNNSSLSLIINKFDLFRGTIVSNNPKRGDVIVFLLPNNRKIHYIKRLIGFPGDEVEIKDNILYINQISVKRKFKGKKMIMYQNKIQYTQNVYQEILPNGINYAIYLNENKKNKKKDFYQKDIVTYKVPQGHYFFMGDNRDNSVDSRFIEKVGYIMKDHLLGKAKFLFWTRDFSILNFISKLQTNRTFTTIQ